MNQLYKTFFLILFLIANVFVGNAQIKKENLKLGFTYGTGSQSKYPFNLKDYTHAVTFYKVQINYKLKQKRKWTYELNIEPDYNVVEHQLLNKWFIKDTDFENYLELRELYTQKRELIELGLNFGFIVRYSIFKPMSVYAISSVGPLSTNKTTERLAKGFAFSDVFGMGISYIIEKIQLDYRYSVRHNSNLEFKQPNNGHNTTNIEFSILFQL